MFYVIGLGLSDEKDITVKGLEVSHSRVCTLLRGPFQAYQLIPMFYFCLGRERL